MNNSVRPFKFFLTNYWPHVLLSILLLILINQVWEQTSSFQSSTYSLSKEKEELSSLLEQTERIEKSDPNQALLLAKDIIERAGALGDDLAMGKAYYWLSAIQLLNARHGTERLLSLSNAKISKDLLLKGEDNFWKANIIELIGSIYSYQMDTYPEESIDSLTLYSHLLDSIHASLPKDTYERTLIRAKLNVLKSTVLEKKDLYSDKEIGRLTLSRPTLQHSILLLSQSLDDFKSINYEEGIGICLRNLANSYNNLDNPIKADSLYQEAILSNKRLGSAIAIYNSLGGIGNFYFSRYVDDGNKTWMEQGIKSYNTALEIEDVDQAETYHSLGKFFHQSAFFIYSSPNLYNPASIRNYLDSADKYYSMAFDTARSERNIYLLKQIIKDYSLICAELTDTSCQVFLTRINDIYPLIPLEIEELSKKAESNYQQFRNNVLEKEKNREQKNTVIIALAVLSFLVSIFILFYSELKQRLERQQLKARLKALQAQMNPHFISNSLSAIKSLIGKKENKLAANYLVDFSRLARTVLDHCQKSKINIREEIEMLELYLSLEKLRMDQKLEYSIQVDDSLDKEKTFIPPMFIQPFAENAIWHGLKHKEGNASLNIQFFRDGSGILVCSVEDNGIGRAKSAELQSESDFQHVSYSTMITKSRVDLLKSEVGHNLQIIDLTDKTGAASGTRVEIFFHQTNKN